MVNNTEFINRLVKIRGSNEHGVIIDYYTKQEKTSRVMYFVVSLNSGCKQEYTRNEIKFI